MKKLSSFAFAAAFAALSCPAFGQLSLVTSRAAFPTTDTVSWSVLGPPFTQITSPFTVDTTGGSTLVVSHNEGTLFERRNQSTGGWGGNFAFGDALLWNQGDNGSVTFDPANLISGAGFNVQSDSAGAFTFRLDAYDTGGGLIGSVTRAGFSNSILGSAIFIGFTSLSVNVDKFVGTLVSGTGSSNFAINTLALSGPAAGSIGAAVPEPSAYGLMGALVVLAGLAHRRFRRQSRAV